MSREIKFRMWDNNAKKWLSEGEKLEDKFIWSFIPELSLKSTMSGVLEQYTGLKDKNGKEIYEGDIVKINGNINYYVDFEHGGFWFNNDNRKWKANRPLTHFVEINDCEVIGNIHENPELLEKENGRDK